MCCEVIRTMAASVDGECQQTAENILESSSVIRHRRQFFLNRDPKREAVKHPVALKQTDETIRPSAFLGCLNQTVEQNPKHLIAQYTSSP